MMIFELEIITPTASQKIAVTWIEIQSPTGNFIIGPNHSYLVSLLKNPGVITYQENQGSLVSLETHGGIFSVHGNKASIILG